MSEQNDLDAPFDEWGDTLPSRRPRVSEQAIACPYCGGYSRPNFIPAILDRPHADWWVECDECGVRTKTYMSRYEAIAAWNKRAGDAEKEESLWGKMVREVGEATSLQTENARLRAELAPLRAEKNEAIGAALAVEQKCYDQAQELAALRALREAANTIYDDLTHYGRDDMASIRQIHGWREALRYALAACDEASAQ